MKTKHPNMSRNRQRDEEKLLVGKYSLEVIWIDDMQKTGDPGPFQMKHFFVIVDDYTDYCWGIESKDKSSTGEFMSSFIKFLKEHRNKIKYIRTDGDGIFNSHEWNVLLDTFDITSVLAPSHEHWLQGKVEKKIQDLPTAANTIRYHHQVPNIFNYQR